MVKDHRPHWLKILSDRINEVIVNLYVKPQLASVGRDFRVMNPRHFQVSGPDIHIKDHVYVMSLYDSPVRLAVFEGLGRIKIGSYCIVNPGVRISSANDIEIGESCMLAMNAYLADADWHDLQHRIYAPGNTAPIKLGNNVWIGDSAFVGKGVTIGDNSIVGAFAVVTKDVPANTIVAGIPAKAVGSIDPDDLTTRKQMFTGQTPYEEFERQYVREQLQGNRLLKYLQTLVYPRRGD